MNRKRTVLAVGGISLLLIAGGGGLAFAGGILGTRPVDSVGTFHTIESRLRPQTEPFSAVTTTGSPMDP